MFLVHGTSFIENNMCTARWLIKVPSYKYIRVVGDVGCEDLSFNFPSRPPFTPPISSLPPLFLFPIYLWAHAPNNREEEERVNELMGKCYGGQWVIRRREPPLGKFGKHCKWPVSPFYKFSHSKNKEQEWNREEREKRVSFELNRRTSLKLSSPCSTSVHPPIFFPKKEYIYTLCLIHSCPFLLYMGGATLCVTVGQEK